jgi:hypothetical protein
MCLGQLAAEPGLSLVSCSSSACPSKNNWIAASVSQQLLTFGQVMVWESPWLRWTIVAFAALHTLEEMVELASPH